MEYFNPVLFLIFVAEVCLGICAWQSPRFLRHLAAHLLTRADIMDLSREESERRMKFWCDKVGLDFSPLQHNANADTVVPNCLSPGMSIQGAVDNR